MANAVGPLAAIVQASASGGFADAVSIPLWVMAIGALGISFGLFLFGPKLIRMVGGQITKLNPMRAYCVALSAAITVIVASWLGLPVSSTHIAVGGVFGVGFFREWDSQRRMKQARVTVPEAVEPPKEERRRRKLVRRSHFLTIIAAWGDYGAGRGDDLGINFLDHLDLYGRRKLTLQVTAQGFGSARSMSYRVERKKSVFSAQFNHLLE